MFNASSCPAYSAGAVVGVAFCAAGEGVDCCLSETCERGENEEEE